MELVDVKVVFERLLGAQVRFFVAGGVAVILHGYVRVTKDLDLVLVLEPENITRALNELAAIGYRPTIPVNLLDFADQQKRERWVLEKRMLVFQLVSDRLHRVPIDIFVRHPFDPDLETPRIAWMEPFPGIRVPVVSRDTLIELKRLAGRPRDLNDIEALNRLQ